MDASSLPASFPASMMTTDDFSFIKTAYESKQWTLVFAMGLMVAVRIATNFRFVADRLRPEQTKWIAVAAAMASSLATNLLTGSGWGMAIVNGLTAGLMAIGSWEALGKAMFK